MNGILIGGKTTTTIIEAHNNNNHSSSCTHQQSTTTTNIMEEEKKLLDNNNSNICRQQQLQLQSAATTATTTTDVDDDAPTTTTAESSSNNVPYRPDLRIDNIHDTKSIREVVKAIMLCCPPSLLLLTAHYYQRSTKPLSSSPLQQEEAAVETTDDYKNNKKDNNNNKATQQQQQLEEEQLQSESLSIKPLSGGLSNELFIVNDTVLIRIHPESEPAATDTTTTRPKQLVDRNIENQLLIWLSDINLAPKLYGIIGNGRIEEYYQNARPLHITEMPIYGEKIAQLLGKLHAQKVPNSIHQLLCGEGSDSNNGNATLPGTIWKRVNDWLSMSKPAQQQEQEDKDTSSGQRQQQRCLLLWERLAQEWYWYCQVMEEHYNDHPQHDLLSNTNTSNADASNKTAFDLFSNQIVLCHMDVQSLNLLLVDENNEKGNEGSSGSNNKHEVELQNSSSESETSESESELHLIDYEYSSYNVRGVDIANTWNEYCDMNNLNADFVREYPSIELQNDFLRSYLSTLYPDDDQQSHHLADVMDVDDPVFLEACRNEINKFTLLSHLQWAIWSLIMDDNKNNDTTSIDFDYIAYAQHRLMGYEICKKEYFPNLTKK